MSGAIMILQVFLLSHILRLYQCVFVCVSEHYRVCVCVWVSRHSHWLFLSVILFPSHLFTFTGDL